MLINTVQLPQNEFDRLDQLFQNWMTYEGRDKLRGEFAAARYEFVLIKASKGYGGSIKYLINVNPKGVGTRTEKETGVVILSRSLPKNAIDTHYLDAVKTDPTLAYRGMAWEEWLFIQKNGFIQSFGHYNIAQESLTLWGDEFGTAAYYAGGFAPWPYKPSFDRPGVVIAIPKSFTMAPKDHPEIPEGERATLGVLDSSAIQAVWMLMPIEVVGGLIEGYVDRKFPPKFEESYFNNPSSYSFIVPYKL